MNDRVKQIFSQAQQLSPEERAELLDMLLAARPEPGSEFDPSWLQEIERRVDRVKRGEAKLYDADDVLAELQAKCG